MTCGQLNHSAELYGLTCIRLGYHLERHCRRHDAKWQRMPAIHPRSPVDG